MKMRARERETETERERERERDMRESERRENGSQQQVNKRFLAISFFCSASVSDFDLIRFLASGKFQPSLKKKLLNHLSYCLSNRERGMKRESKEREQGRESREERVGERE